MELQTEDTKYTKPPHDSILKTDRSTGKMDKEYEQQVEERKISNEHEKLANLTGNQRMRCDHHRPGHISA